MNYHIARDGQQLGVFPQEEVQLKLQSGEFRPTDLCWAEGMADWQPLRVLELSSSSAVNPYAPPTVDVSIQKPGQQAVLATLGQRFAAAMLDLLMALVCAVPIMMGFAMTETSSGELTSQSGILIAIGGLAFLALLVVNLVLLTQKGQTLGKKWVNIRIAAFDTQANPGFVKAVLLRSFVNGIIGSIPMLGGIYSLVDICFIFREDRRCIHDLIAGTHVVQGTLP